MALPLTTFTDLFARREGAQIVEEQEDLTAEISKAEEEGLALHLQGQQANLAALKEAGVWDQNQLPSVDTEDGQYLRGYIDDQGNPTESGELFAELHAGGIFDDRGGLTQKGQAFALGKEGVLNSDNIEAYKIRKQSGLDSAPDTSFMDSLSAAGGAVADIAKGFYKSATAPVRVMLGGSVVKEASDYLIRSQEMSKGAIGGPYQLGAGMDLALDKIAADLAGSDEYYWREMQAYDRDLQDWNDRSAGSVMGLLGASDEAVKAAESMRAVADAGSTDKELAAREGQAMGMVADPTNLATMGIGGSAAKLPMLSRLGLKAEQAAEAGLIARKSALEVAKATRELNLAKFTGKSAQNEAKFLENAGRIAESQAMFGKSAEAFRKAETLAGQIPELQASAAARQAWAQKVLQDAGPAPAVMAGVEQARAIGRQVRAAPAQSIGGALDSIASGLEKADTALGPMLDKFAKVRQGAAWLGIATGNPMAAAPEALRQAIAAGPAVRGIGNFTKILGNELMEARGSVPFWQRVKQAETATPIMRAVAGGMDNATLGGKVFTPFRRAAQVPGALAQAAPVNILFQGLAKGGDFSADTFKEGLAQSLIFDGGAAYAGALTGGKLNDLRAKHAGDELNFRTRLSPDQAPMFKRMNGGARKNVAAYAAAFPELRMEFTESGPSSFDRGTNTAVINVNGDKLRPLVAHEVNHYLAVKGQSEDGIIAMLMGDDTNPGLVRSRDGRLDPNFKAAMDAYNSRMAENKLPPLDAREFALEYFNEATVDSLMGAADSGRLAKLAGRSDFERTVAKVIEATVPKLPILRDLFFRLGGAIKDNGQMVEGNGLLAGGIREIPGAKAMVDAIVKEQAGRRRDGSRTSDPVKLDPKDVAPDAMFSAFDTDQSGKVILDEKGNPKPLSAEKDKARSEAGKAAIAEIERETLAEGSGAKLEPLPDDPVVKEEAGTETTQQRSTRVKRNPKGGGYSGTHLSPRQIQAIRKQGVLNDLQFELLRMVNRASRDLTGETFNVIYHPAIETSGSGGKKYATRPAELYEAVPFGVKINKAGGLYIEFLNVTRLLQTANKLAGTEKGKRLYKGDPQAIIKDIEGVLGEFRKGAESSEGYLRPKYGEKWKEYRNFLNSTMNTLTNDQKAANPDVAALGKQENKVVESFRIDRISKTARSKGGMSLPFMYQDVKLNHFPSGVPQ